MNIFNGKAFPFSVLCAALAVAAACEKQDSPEQDGEKSGPIIINESPAAIKGELIIKIKDSSAGTRAAGSSDDALAGTREVSEVLAQNGKFRLERLFPECGRFEARTHAEGLDTWYIASFDKTLETSDVVAQLKKCGSVESIEYSLPVVMSDAQGEGSPAIAPMAAAASRKDLFPFNESKAVQQMQWHYNNTGSIFGKTGLVGADADVWAAWKLCAGNPDVIVAVIDQGVKYDHEDLADNMWINKGEIPGNGIDDDGNGYIDDVYGFNFVDNKGTIVTSSTLSHGTHVAGTIAAVNNNGIGVNGIAGGSGNHDGVRIMTLQTLGASENGPALDSEES